MKTVRVRIPVMVDPRGNWNGFGWGGGADGLSQLIDTGCLIDGMPDETTSAECGLYYIEAHVPVPTDDSRTIEGRAGE